LRPFAEHDPYAAPSIDRIASLSAMLESIPTLCKVLPSYRRTQEHFVGTFHWIMEQYHRDPTGDGREQRNLLTMLYQETIQKMEALLEMATPHHDDNNDNEDGWNGAKPLANATATATRSSSLSSSSPCRSMSKSSSPLLKNKSSLSSYMTNWLRENWTNPYPDEMGVAVMANECGTSPSVVSNWLINARTRKWRPAIKKAYLLHRTADHLLEDSMDIFDGKIIPGFEHHDVFHNRQANKRSRLSK
jgi:hypothetical protein